MKKHIYLIVLWSLLLMHPAFSQGHVYLVIGSDTAIWDGMNTAQYNCTYDDGLFTNPSMNAYRVMNPQFRLQLKDSYGTHMKMTWWMMAGNIFRYATNTNVPLANNITLYNMKKHHSESIKFLDDELSLHYHTFAWTDYDNDNKYWWNQARNFTECFDDFNITLAQFLLEENTFPVSFRSGWHYMDNEWQNYLDGLVPYSLHNDYPNVREDNVEPTDNNYDWSKASKEFVPYHPSTSNYQLEGDGKSWNTRSRFMGSVSQTMMDQIFAKADNGTDQVPCFWAHLPEENFLDNMKRIDSLAHISAAKYPAVKFRYCTAVEAMQRWRKGLDTIAPDITIEEVISGSDIKFKIYSNEEIYQTKPFVAAKNIYEDYFILDCMKLNETSWITKEAIPQYSLAKIGTALTDKMGNLTTEFINYLPDDIYIDNQDDEYLEKKGMWNSYNLSSWGSNSRQCILSSTDTAVVEWNPSLSESGLFNLWVQVPSVSNAADKMHFNIISGSSTKKLQLFNEAFTSNEWNYISTVTLVPGDKIQMTTYGFEQPGKTIITDVLKLSALVKDKSICVKGLQFQSNMVCEKDSLLLQLTIQNQGIQSLQIITIHSVNGFFNADTVLPLEVPGMSTSIFPVIFFADKSGSITDTLIIISNDSRKPVIKIPYNLEVLKYFRIIDNQDSVNYTETGTWSTSNSEAWGNSSRYCWGGTQGSAKFTVDLKYPGLYEISFIVPTTQNAVKNALYIIREGRDTIAETIVDQNVGSGEWVSLGSFNLEGNKPVEIIIKETGPIETNKVLRTDAIKFQLSELTVADKPSEVLNRNFHLMQNYPNPFNPETKIGYYLNTNSSVELNIYNTLGQSVSRYFENNQSVGEHNITFNGASLSSGIYFYSIRIISEEDNKEFRDMKKMILLR